MFTRFCKLLSISYKFVKRSLAITSFNSLLFHAETYMICVNIFMYSETKFQLDPTKHCKNRSLWQRHVYKHEVTKVGDFPMGSMENLFIFCQIKLKFVSGNIKNIDTYHVSLSRKKRSSQKHIAKKSFDKLI